MDKRLSKPELIRIADQITRGERIDAAQVQPFLAHEFAELSPFAKFMLRVAALISLFFASVLVIFPEVGEYLIGVLPGVFLLPERLARALDYVWSLVGKPVGKQHLMYHLPNIIIYAFGVAGLRQLWRRINKNNWKDRVTAAREGLEKAIDAGSARFRFAPGFSLLFVGQGDRTARSLVADDPLIGPTLSTARPAHTVFWGRYAVGEGDEGFERVLDQVNAEDAGEYLLFPVVDEHLFLPGPTEFDLAPHRVEIAVQRIREFEQERAWLPKRIVIVGDKQQTSRFITTSETSLLHSPDDEVSLRSISDEYPNVIVADPTDITLNRIIEIADGRRILFRASEQGAEKYARTFYDRLSLLGYTPTREATLTVGYDISDLETEHQVLAHKESGYLPVILSRDIFDLLSKNHLNARTHVFVPNLVKQELQRLVADT